MGKMQDASVQAQWSSWYIRLHDANGTEVTNHINSTGTDPIIPDVDETGLRPLPLVNNKAVFSASFRQVVADFSKYLTGYIFASTEI
jgi:hypothetical protein